MSTMTEQEFAEAVAGTKKDKALVAAANNERTSSPGMLYAEFSKLPVDRQLEIIASIANDNFVAAQWKIAFPLRSLSADAQKIAVPAAGKILFLVRDEDSLREAVRAIKLFQESPFFQSLVPLLSDCAELVGSGTADASKIITDPEIYGIIQSLDPEHPASEKIIQCIVRTAGYTRNLRATAQTALFLYNRRYSPDLSAIATLLEESIFLAREPRNVMQILSGLGAGAIDMVLQQTEKKEELLSSVQEIAWKTRSARAIRDHLRSYLPEQQITSA